MKENTNPSPLPAPVSLTLEEAMQIAGGSLSAAQFSLEHIIIGRPAFQFVNPVVSLPLARAGRQ
jgi:hypothetical protein